VQSTEAIDLFLVLTPHLLFFPDLRFFLTRELKPSVQAQRHRLCRRRTMRFDSIVVKLAANGNLGMPWKMFQPSLEGPDILT